MAYKEYELSREQLRLIESVCNTIESSLKDSSQRRVFIRELLGALEDKWCLHCGGSPGCQCWNDE